jgi:predicted DNA-binding helix-hairpin-helix protein
MGILMKRAQYFISCNELSAFNVNETSPEYVRLKLTEKKSTKKNSESEQQTTLIFPD